MRAALAIGNARVGIAQAGIALALATGGICCGGGVQGENPSYAVGVLTLQAPTGPIDVWYPATRRLPSTRSASYDLADWLPPSMARTVPAGTFRHSMGGAANLLAARGVFPLLLFAHGLYSFRDQSSFLTSWLASEGYVVAAPELPRDLTAYFTFSSHAPPGAPSDYQVLASTEAQLGALARDPASQLYGRIRMSELVVIGHSLGGLDAVQFATRGEVAGYVAMAAGFPTVPGSLPSKDSLYLAGERDGDIPLESVRATFASAPHPRSLVVIADAGHLAFTDLCEIAQSSGGLARLGRDIRVDPASHAPFSRAGLDGCGPGYLPAAAAHRVIDQAVLAFLAATLQHR